MDKTIKIPEETYEQLVHAKELTGISIRRIVKESVELWVLQNE